MVRPPPLNTRVWAWYATAVENGTVGRSCLGQVPTEFATLYIDAYNWTALCYGHPLIQREDSVVEDAASKADRLTSVLETILDYVSAPGRDGVSADTLASTIRELCQAALRKQE